MTFDEWYEQQEWFHDPSDRLERVWDLLETKGLDPDEISDIFDTITGAIRNEYGD